MSKFSGLAEAFDKRKAEDKSADLTDKASLDDVSALKKSLAVISVVDKMQSAGVSITKKAKMDYLLALRFVEQASLRAGRDLLEEYKERQQMAKKNNGAPPPSSSVGASFPDKPHDAGFSAQPVPRKNPGENPQEFQKALISAQTVVAQVERMQKEGKAVTPKLMDTYMICRKFLEKYSR